MISPILKYIPRNSQKKKLNKNLKNLFPNTLNLPTKWPRIAVAHRSSKKPWITFNASTLALTIRILTKIKTKMSLMMPAWVNPPLVRMECLMKKSKILRIKNKNKNWTYLAQVVLKSWIARTLWSPPISIKWKSAALCVCLALQTVLDKQKIINPSFMVTKSTSNCPPFAWLPFMMARSKMKPAENSSSRFLITLINSKQSPNMVSSQI